MAPVTVETLMTSKVVSVRPETPIADVVGKLHAYRISCVVVCEDEMPLGIISERDVIGYAYGLVSDRDELRRTAGELMSSGVTTVGPEDSLEHALDLVVEQRIRHLPVVDADGRLLGLLTQTDIMRACHRAR